MRLRSRSAGVGGRRSSALDGTTRSRLPVARLLLVPACLASQEAGNLCWWRYPGPDTGDRADRTRTRRRPTYQPGAYRPCRRLPGAKVSRDRPPSSPAHPLRPSCRAADASIARFPGFLQVAGGAPLHWLRPWGIGTVPTGGRRSSAPRRFSKGTSGRAGGSCTGSAGWHHCCARHRRADRGVLPEPVAWVELEVTGSRQSCAARKATRNRRSGPANSLSISMIVLFSYRFLLPCRSTHKKEHS